MKKNKFFPLIIYVGILVLAFSLIWNIFEGGVPEVSYSQLIDLFEEGKVKSFTAVGNDITLQLHTQWEGSDRVGATLNDPEGFRQSMWELLQAQTEAGTLESYNFLPGKELSPYDFIFPIVLAGLVLFIIWGIVASKNSQFKY